MLTRGCGRIGILLSRSPNAFERKKKNDINFVKFNSLLNHS
jgi:hypothetical protein